MHRAKEADQPMPSRAQRERSDRRRALRLLADTPEGVTEALMLAHGFRVALLVDLCIAGLAIARPEHMRAGDARWRSFAMKITDLINPAWSAARS